MARMRGDEMDEEPLTEGQQPQQRQGRPFREKVEYETLKIETINYGTNNFIEVAKKRAPNGNVFISLSKGWYPAQSTEKRYKAGIGFPLEKEILEQFLKALNEVIKD